MATVPVIGRDSEREAIEQWLDADRPAMLRIEGVAGIGKSTLWSYAVDRARARGDRVLAWRAYSSERDIAFAVLTALFDTDAVIAALDQLPGPRRHGLEVAMARVDPAQRSPEPSLVGLAIADVLRILATSGSLLIGVD